MDDEESKFGLFPNTFNIWTAWAIQEHCRPWAASLGTLTSTPSPVGIQASQLPLKPGAGQA